MMSPLTRAGRCSATVWLAGALSAWPAAAVDSSTARHSWTRPGELRVELGAEPSSLNPLLQLNDYENS
jgi:hypothetical protein